MTADLSATMEGRKQWDDTLNVKKEKRSQRRILHSSKMKAN